MGEMEFSKDEIESIIKLLSGNVKDDLLGRLLKAMGKPQENSEVRPGENYLAIKGYCNNLRNHLMARGKGIVAPKAEEEVFAVLMEKGNVARILSEVPRNGYLGAFLGMEQTPKSERLTIALLALNSRKEILDAHKKSQLGGEESWGEQFNFSEMNKVLL